MSPTGAFFIGIVAGFVVIWATDALEYLRIDDPIGAVPVHLVVRHLGHAVARALRDGRVRRADADRRRYEHASSKGSSTAAAFGQLKAQAIGSGAVCLATFVVAIVLMYAVKATGTLRISREGELEGLDLHEHGMVAYPEYVIHGYDMPHVSSSVDVGPVAVRVPASESVETVLLVPGNVSAGRLTPSPSRPAALRRRLSRRDIPVCALDRLTGRNRPVHV